MRKMMLVCVCLVLVVALSAGCAPSVKGIAGTWVRINGDDSTYGYALRFSSDGRFWCTPDLHDAPPRKLDAAFAQMNEYITATYSIADADTILLSAVVLFGTLDGEIDYALDGDVLIFDGGTYRRLTGFYA